MRLKWSSATGERESQTSWRPRRVREVTGDQTTTRRRYVCRSHSIKFYTRTIPMTSADITDWYPCVYLSLCLSVFLLGRLSLSARSNSRRQRHNFSVVRLVEPLASSTSEIERESGRAVNERDLIIWISSGRLKAALPANQARQRERERESSLSLSVLYEQVIMVTATYVVSSGTFWTNCALRLADLVG